MRSLRGTLRHGYCNDCHAEGRQGDNAEDDSRTDRVRIELRDDATTRVDERRASYGTDCTPSCRLRALYRFF
ncbi:hypothetical protein AQ875_09900 [Burkholderia pseudomallei]|nr:hypothetical protein AQ875_09900 [Burkholderia pseudomallei]